MEPDQALCFTPVSHPDPRVQRVGFDLTDPYVEQCWSAVVGPTSVLLLRRLPTMWMARVPVEMGASELSQTLGLGVGVGKNSRLDRKSVASGKSVSVRVDLGGSRILNKKNTKT